MIKFVYQHKPLGTGDAVLKTKKYIRDKFFLMLLPDDLIIKKNLKIKILCFPRILGYVFNPLSIWEGLIEEKP